MSNLTALSSTITSQAENAENKLKEASQKAKMDEEQFIQQLFVFLQKTHGSISEQEIDSQKKELTDLLEEGGYQDLPTALNSAKNARGQTPLVQALQNQDFPMARILLDFGAEYDSLAREEYDIAIRSERGRESGDLITPPKDYIQSEPEKLHTVKEFGLILGLDIISRDGTPSQRGHVGPTYKLMTDAVKKYGQGRTEDPAKGDFKQISDAFAFANNVAKYQYSTPEGSPAAGNALSQQIQKGEVTSVPINCTGHAMGLSFVPVEGNPDKTYLVFTNRGEGAKPGEEGTRIYEVDKKDITPDFINNVMSGHDKGLSHAQVMKQIHEVTQRKDPVSVINQKPQKYDNCTVANTRANIHGVLLCQEANRIGGFKNVNQETKDKVKDRYKEFTDDMKSKKVQQLEKALEKNPEDPDLKALTKAYKDKVTSKSMVAEKSEKFEKTEESITMRSPL
ncbi:TPA: Dot/Icm T4SS effector AnkD/LegA15 [Legionella anisa]